MTPQEKAHSLFGFYFCSIDGENAETIAKNFATKTVDEILNSGALEPQLQRHRINGVKPEKIHLEYWVKVKQEIQKL